MGLVDRAFPLINDLALRKATPFRADLLARARGTVLEIGMGSGLNLRHYGPEVERVIGVEPDEAMWARGRERADELGLPVERLAAYAEELPLDDNSVDTAVSTFVLCSVRDPARVLAELHRVVRPGGRLLIMEHVENPSRLVATGQRLVTPVWTRCFGGCHPGRDLVAALDASPWQPVKVDFLRLPGLPRVVHYHLFGEYEAGGRA